MSCEQCLCDYKSPAERRRECRFKPNAEQVELIDPSSGTVVIIPFSEVLRYLCSTNGDPISIINTPTCPGSDCPLLITADNIPNGINIMINPVLLVPPCEFLEAASFTRLGTMNPYITNINVSGTYDIMIFRNEILIRTISGVQQGESVLIPELQGGEKRIGYLYVNDPSQALSIFLD